MLIATGSLLLDTENILYARAEAEEGEITSIKVVLKDPSRTSFMLKGDAADEFRAAVLTSSVYVDNSIFKEKLTSLKGQRLRRVCEREVCSTLDALNRQLKDAAMQGVRINLSVNDANLLEIADGPEQAAQASSRA